jgi:alpha/beta superfamily hydrolase
MIEELVLQRGSNKIRATLYGKSLRGILLCPPHPRYGGSRQDLRLVGIANELANSGVSALCLDYSAYTGGTEEIKDALFTLEYMSERMTSLGLLGYSYGAVIASNAAAQFQNLKGLVLISPLKKVNDLKIATSSACKKLIIYGLRDTLVTEDIDEIYDLSEGEKQRLSLDTDHFYLGYERDVARAVVEFFHEALEWQTKQT